jgi:hypothetical protein
MQKHLGLIEHDLRWAHLLCVAKHILRLREPGASFTGRKSTLELIVFSPSMHWSISPEGHAIEPQQQFVPAVSLICRILPSIPEQY